MSAFSVLMSVYKNDNAAFLMRALESISFEQTVKPGQIVLVVDGTVHDEIFNTISDFSDKLGDAIKFTVIFKEVNSGLAAALNTGLEACEYDLIARMDSDDISLPDRFAIQTNYMTEHPDIAVLGGNILEFECDESIIVDKRVVPSEHEKIVKMLKTRNAVNHMSVMFRKSVIMKIGGYCENFGKLEDYKLWVDVIVAQYKIHNLSQILVKARIGNGFLDRRSNRREIRDWDMLQSYLLSVGMIKKSTARKNKLYIRVFIYMPKWMKKILYKTILRKKSKDNDVVKHEQDN